MSVNSRLHNLGTGEVFSKKPFFINPYNYSVECLLGVKGSFLVTWRFKSVFRTIKYKSFKGAFDCFRSKSLLIGSSSDFSYVYLIDLSTNEKVFSYSSSRLDSDSSFFDTFSEDF